MELCVKHTDPTTTGIMSNLKYEEFFGPEIRLVFDNATLKSSDKQKRHINGNPSDIESFSELWNGYEMKNKS